MRDYKVLLGEKIKSLRSLKGMTQEQLAENVNRSKNHISKIEQGVANPPLELLINIANVLSVEPVELFDFYGNVELNSISSSLLTQELKDVSERHLRILYNVHRNLQKENIL